MFNSTVRSPRHGKSYRTKLLVLPKFQMTLIAVNTMIMAVTLAFIAFQAHRSFSMVRQMGVEARLSPSHEYFTFVDFQLHNLYSYLSSAFLIGFSLSAFFTLVISRKLAGPIVRLKSHFMSISKGYPVTKLSFRRGDFFTDLPAVINEAVESLKKETKKDKEADRAA